MYLYVYLSHTYYLLICLSTYSRTYIPYIYVYIDNHKGEFCEGLETFCSYLLYRRFLFALHHSIFMLASFIFIFFFS